MNPFTTHPRQQNLTYSEHWCFAMGIACHLLTSVVAFALHATLPSVPIRPRLDLEATAAYLAERNSWLEAGKDMARAGAFPDIAQLGHERAIPGQLAT
jgi:hypothetical protein